jgi:hypothetical protein
LNDFLNEVTTNHQMTPVIRDMFNIYDNDAKLSFYRTFKNDLFLSLYQNELRKLNVPEGWDAKKAEEAYVTEMQSENAAPVDTNVFQNKIERDNFLYQRERIREAYPFNSVSGSIEFAEYVKANELKDNQKHVGESTEDYVKRLEEKSYEEYIRDKALYAIYNPNALFKGDNNLGAKFTRIMDQYPVLSERFTLLNNIKVNSFRGFTNLMPSTFSYSKDEINIFHENFKDLANSSKLIRIPDITQRDADYISEFFNKLPEYLYMQSGPNAFSPFSFARTIPTENYLRTLEQPVKALTESIDELFLEDFLNRFIYANHDAQTRNRFKEYLKPDESKPTMQYNLFKKPETQKVDQSLNGVVYSDNIITRAEVKSKPDTLFLFGDNDIRSGLGGQAKEMRGEPNAIGISTKKQPNNNPGSFKTDGELEENKRIITQDIDKTIAVWKSGKYKSIIIPPIGVGLAKLPEMAPETYKFLLSEFNRLENTIKGKITTETPTSLTQVVNHSGGADGADSVWDDVGKMFGVVDHRHYWHAKKTPRGNVQLTDEQVAEGIVHAKAAAKVLGRPWNDQYASLLGRNWYQVKNSTQVVAVAPLIKPGEKNSKGYESKAARVTVDGGTGYAVEMAIANGKEVNVFDTKTNKWFKWNGSEFVESSVPVLHKNFAGIGSRQDKGKMTPESVKAIRDVYQNTQASLGEKEVKETPETLKIITDSELEEAMRSCIKK